MSDACVDPSALHLKKELTALRKARFLRDPETSSSWRSPLSSRSVAATSSRNYGNVFRGNSIATNNSCGLFELESNLLSRSEKNQKKVFLYNWRQHSSKSIDSGGKLDRDDGQGSVLEPYEKISQNAQKEGCNSDGYLKDLVFRSKAENPETRTRRTLGGLKKSSISKHRPVKKKSISMQLNLPSPSLCSASPSLSGYENWSRSSKILKSNRREEDSSYSYTPASTSSYIRHRQRKTSTIGSCDGNTTSVDGDEEDQLDLLQRRQVCGIPCYWSKRMNRSCGGCYSPSSHSDTSSRRKGGSIFRGSQRSYHRRRSLASHKRDPFSRSAQRLPLLTNSRDGGGSSIGTTSDELSTNYGELDLEGSSRLDGRRWSSCMSQEGLKLTLTVGAGDIMGDERILSQKYSPRSFDELVGQNIVVKSLTNTISGGRIAPVYLFQGPRGTGKTSTARIFAAALNCLSIEETKPCGFCRECTNFASGKSTDVIEVDATNKNGINRVGNLLKNLFLSPTFSSYKVFIINDCHMLSSKTWSAFLRFIEKPPLHVVFIFITTVPDNLPRSVVSRCRKYVFPKIKEADIVSRLKKLSAEENLDVESDALDLIALNSDGSLRDAETMLDQLSLLGKRITTSLVNDLVGVVSDEKLLDLLELAMSSDTAETVKRARELMDSGVDPMALMSQLERLIMDIIAGTYHLVDSKRSGYFCGRSLNEAELMRLKQSLKILSEAENQIRVSSENSTWFTAALLQLGSAHSPDRAFSSSSSQHSARKMKEDGASVIARETLNGKKKQRVLYVPRKSNSFSIVRTVNGHSSPNRNASSSTSMTELPSCSRYVEGSTLATTYKNITARNGVVRCVSPDKLDGIWKSCVERCHSKTLRHMLWSHGKLVSISEVEGVLIVFIGFVDGDIKSRAERFLSSITNSIELVLRHNVEIRLGLMPDGENPVNGVKTIELPDSLARMQMETIGVMEEERKLDNVSSHELNNAGLKLPRKGRNSSKCKLQETLDSCDGTPGLVESFHTVGLPVFSEEESTRVCSTREKSQEIPIQTIRAAIDEQRLESAWLQAAERSTPGSVNRVKPEKNQVMPQDGMSHQNQMAWNVSSKIWEEELNREINKALQISSNRSRQKGPNNKEVDYYAMSPSLLHDKSLGANFDKESLGYESGPACNGLICWKSTKPYKGKVKQATRVPSHKPGSFSLFGRCAKSKTPENW